MNMLKKLATLMTVVCLSISTVAVANPEKTMHFSSTKSFSVSSREYKPSYWESRERKPETRQSGNYSVEDVAYQFSNSRPATGQTVFIFDPKQFAWAVYSSEGDLIKTGRASGGRSYCSDLKRPCRTPVGVHRVYRIGNANCKSTKFPIGRGGAPMPYCAFFMGGFAIHGSNDVPKYNASHGCIRVQPTAARWLTDNALDVGSTVIVRSY